MSEENQANGEETMRVDPQRAQVLAENVGGVLQKISGASGGRKVRHAQDLQRRCRASEQCR